MSYCASCIDIDTNALAHNLHRIRQFAPHTKILAMVKANAYGHGLANVARALPDVEGFGVACLTEALYLRKTGVKQRIVLMRGVLTPEELQLAQSQHIELVIHTLNQIDLLEQQHSTIPISVWLKINTGMNRLGLFPHQIQEAYQRLIQIAYVKQPLHWVSHFATAEEAIITQEQIDCFYKTTAGFSGEKSLANSAAIVKWPKSHADWVRPGIMLYGVSPFLGQTASDHGLQPVMTWRSSLMVVRQQQQGDAIGYWQTFRCPETMPIGIVGVGYGDGYPRHAKTGTPVLVNAQRVALIGRVSMDMLAVDLRTQPNAKVGDPVVLWGKGLPVEEVATHTATTAYELLCGVRSRI